MCAGIQDKQFVLNHHLECPNEIGEDGYFTLETIFNAKKKYSLNIMDIIIS